MKKLLLLVSIAFSIQANAQWVQQNSTTTNFLMSIHFPSTSVGYSLAETGYLYKTTNGGTNWNMVGSHQDMWGQVYFTSIDTGFVTGARGVLKTVNGGLTWVDNFSDSIYTNSLSFVTSDIGYVTGININGDSTLVYKTTNAGATWSRVSSIYTFMGVQAIYFINASTGFLNSYGDALYKTVDGGLTWIPKSTVSTLYSFSFPSPLIGYAVGDFDLLKTTDGGETWNVLTNTNPQALYSVFFTSNTTGYIVGGDGFSSGAIEKTIDGGATWSVDLGIAQTFNSVHFPNANYGYACGTAGTIYKLTTTVDITETPDATTLTLSPNPVSNQLTVTSQKATIKEIKIMNSLGEEMKNWNLGMGNEKSATVDVSGIAKGIYFIQLTDENKNSINKKIIIQ